MEISIATTVNASLEQVWDAWTTPEQIVQWNFASDEWHCPEAEIDLVVGGTFKYRMEAKDGSMGFDFEGVFTKISPKSCIEYALADDRKVRVTFTEAEGSVTVKETFEAENEMSGEQQKQGWLCILENFKKHVEASGAFQFPR